VELGRQQQSVQREQRLHALSALGSGGSGAAGVAGSSGGGGGGGTGGADLGPGALLGVVAGGAAAGSGADAAADADGKTSQLVLRGFALLGQYALVRRARAADSCSLFDAGRLLLARQQALAGGAAGGKQNNSKAKKQKEQQQEGGGSGAAAGAGAGKGSGKGKGKGKKGGSANGPGGGTGMARAVRLAVAASAVAQRGGSAVDRAYAAAVWQGEGACRAWLAAQESDYNAARAYQQMGLLHLAAPLYERLLGARPPPLLLAQLKRERGRARALLARDRAEGAGAGAGAGADASANTDGRNKRKRGGKRGGSSSAGETGVPTAPAASVLQSVCAGLRHDAAHNLAQIYKASGALLLAHDVLVSVSRRGAGVGAAGRRSVGAAAGPSRR
jgi:hypothetical protein